jgi:hypothetical protein
MMQGHRGALVDVVTVFDHQCFYHESLKHWCPPLGVAAKMVPQTPQFVRRGDDARRMPSVTTVDAHGIVDAAQLQAIVESIRPLDDTEWADLDNSVAKAP